MQDADPRPEAGLDRHQARVNLGLRRDPQHSRPGCGVGVRKRERASLARCQVLLRLHLRCELKKAVDEVVRKPGIGHPSDVALVQHVPADRRTQLPCRVQERAKAWRGRACAEHHRSSKRSPGMTYPPCARRGRRCLAISAQRPGVAAAVKVIVQCRSKACTLPAVSVWTMGASKNTADIADTSCDDGGLGRNLHLPYQVREL